MTKKNAEISLSVCNLGASRGYRTLFKGLSFSVVAGDVLELRGENGSGKSTLLRILAGLTRPDVGFLSFVDADEGAQRPKYYPVHFLGHQDGIKAQESVEDQLLFWAKFFGEDKSKVKPVLEKVGLWKRRDVPGRGLSAGQRRRLSLARLLIAYRPIWLLDEPFAALDSMGQDLVKELIADHAAQGGIVVAAMHGVGFENARTIEIAPPVLTKTQIENLAAII